MRDLIHAGLKRLNGDPSPRGQHEATVLAVCASKGGVGKTTTAVHLATGLARFHGRKTLLVDLDPQGHVGRCLQRHVPSAGPSLGDLLRNRQRQEVVEIALPTALNDLSITAPDRSLADAEAQLASRIGRELLLRNSLRRTRTHFDFIVLDCPPHLGNLTLNGLLAADAVLIPCDPSPLAVQGVEDLLATVATLEQDLGQSPALLGVLRTRVDRRNKTVHGAINTLLERTYGTALLRTEIGVNTTLARAQTAGTTVYELDAKSRGARDYRSLVDEVLAKLEGSRRPN